MMEFKNITIVKESTRRRGASLKSMLIFLIGIF
jgi:hypothetical protein